LDKKSHKKTNKLTSYGGIPIIIKAISFFLILGSSIALLLYGYIFFFNLDVMAEEISIIKNPIISPQVYVIIESLVFISIISGAVFLLYLKKRGIFIILAGLVSLILMNYTYFVKIDWLYIAVTFTIMLIFGFYWKNFD